MIDSANLHNDQFKKISHYYLDAGYSDKAAELASYVHMMTSLLLMEEMLDKILDILTDMNEAMNHGN